MLNFGNEGIWEQVLYINFSSCEFHLGLKVYKVKVVLTVSVVKTKQFDYKSCQLMIYL